MKKTLITGRHFPIYSSRLLLLWKQSWGQHPLLPQLLSNSQNATKSCHIYKGLH